MILHFRFWDPVFIKRDESRGGKQFPSNPNEVFCRFVGFSESVGHAMTYKVLTSDTRKVLYRSRVCLANESDNLRARQPLPSAPDTDLSSLNSDAQGNTKVANLPPFYDADDQDRVFDPGGHELVDRPTEFYNCETGPWQ